MRPEIVFTPKSLRNALLVNISKLRPDAGFPAEKTSNDTLVGVMKKGPQWFEVCLANKSITDMICILTVSFKIGAARYRQMRENEKTALPRSICLDQAKDIHIPWREGKRDSVPATHAWTWRSGQGCIFAHSPWWIDFSEWEGVSSARNSPWRIVD